MNFHANSVALIKPKYQTVNKISVEGARALGESLKVNKTLTALDLRCAQQQDGYNSTAHH